MRQKDNLSRENIYTYKEEREPFSQWLKSLPARFLEHPAHYLVAPFKWLANLLLGRIIGLVVLPAQWRRDCTQSFTQEAVGAFNTRSNGYAMTPHRVVIPGYSELETVILTHTSQSDKLPGDQTYTIVFTPNSINAADSSWIDEQIEENADLQDNLVLFNYAGVGASTGHLYSDQDLVRMGKAQVGLLIEKGVHPQKILLKGRSLGGVAATLTAAACHEKGLCVSLFNICSLSSVTHHMKGPLLDLAKERKDAGLKETWLMKMDLRIVGALAKLVAFAGYALEAGEAYSQLPEANKEYVCIRPDKSQKQQAQPAEKYTLASMQQLQQDQQTAGNEQGKQNTLYVAMCPFLPALKYNVRTHANYLTESFICVPPAKRINPKFAAFLEDSKKRDSLNLNDLKEFLPEILYFTSMNKHTPPLPGRDKVIPHSASIYTYLKNKRAGNGDKGVKSLNAPKDTKTNKMQPTNPVIGYFDLHIVPLEMLEMSSSPPMPAITFYTNCVRRARANPSSEAHSDKSSGLRNSEA